MTGKRLIERIIGIIVIVVSIWGPAFGCSFARTGTDWFLIPWFLTGIFGVMGGLSLVAHSFDK